MERPIVVEQTFSASAAEVWHAITDPQQMPRWFFDTIRTFEPRVGHESSFVVHADGADYVHRWNVLEVEPERRIVYRWRYDGISGDSTVAWDLASTSDGTKLTVTHTGHETFPRTPVFSREAGEGGWNYFIRERLKAFLDGVGP